MKATLIIATYKREFDLVRAIKSVLNQKYNSFELIIVDQTEKHSTTTQNFLNNVKDKRYRYYLVSPPSIPAAENFGVSKAKGEIVIFIDDDVELEDNFIEEHVKAYQDKSVGGVAGRIKVPGQPQSRTLYRVTTTGWNIGGFDYGNNAITRSGVRGCNMSFRKSVLTKLGGFDTGFIKNAYRFESDISYRVMAAGYKIIYKSSASLIHYHTVSGGSRANSSLFRDAESFANDFRFFYKNMNHSRRALFGFYFMHLVYTVPHPRLKITLERIHYLARGSKIAKQALTNKNIIISKEIPRSTNAS